MTRKITVPDGQTPLTEKLGHPLLDVFNEGATARDNGTGSPYHGHSLEHCLHAAGWVQRDLRLALDAALDLLAKRDAELARAEQTMRDRWADHMTASARFFEMDDKDAQQSAAIESAKASEALACADLIRAALTPEPEGDTP